MSYRVTYRGLHIECDSLTEIDRLADELEARKQPPVSLHRVSGGSAPPELPKYERIKLLMQTLSAEQRIFLQELVGAHQRGRGPLLLREFPIEPSKIGALVTNLGKAAQRMGLALDDLVNREKSRNGSGKRQSHYSIVSNHVEAIAEGVDMPMSG